MDSVRLGRALGVGARAAAKTLVTAVDAATAPNPSKPSASQANSRPQAARPAQTNARSGNEILGQVSRAAEQISQTSNGLSRGGKQLSQSVWNPLKRLSGVLWLEFTGVFFGLFALSAATAAWKLRGALHETATNHDARTHFLMAVGMATLFTYFCVSSFVRAKRKERGR